MVKNPTLEIVQGWLALVRSLVSPAGRASASRPARSGRSARQPGTVLSGVRAGLCWRRYAHGESARAVGSQAACQGLRDWRGVAHARGIFGAVAGAL